jgi:hypothetical protein
MIIISIDVGLKNLAFSVLQPNINKLNFNILDCHLINLIDNDEPKKCNALDKKNNICDKKATFYKNQQYYCKTHARNTEYVFPTNDLNPHKLKSKKINDLIDMINNCQIQTSEKPTKKELIDLLQHYIETRCLEVVSEVPSVKPTLYQKAQKIKLFFDFLWKKYEYIDIVLIENQIAPDASKMYCIQGMLTQYFVMQDEKVGFVKDIGSVNKLKYFTENKTLYKERKKTSVLIATNILETDFKENEAYNTLTCAKKKDDLADCLLQGIWYMIQNNLLSKDYALKFWLP